MSKVARKTSQIAEKFAQNWKERRLDSEGQEENQDELDDSLTNLQWLHNITLIDITPAADSPSTSSSPRLSEDDLAETLSEKSDANVVNLKHDKQDYMTDPSKKPPYSYATLICMAMRETKKSKITLSAIYKWIRENFVYYRHADPTWQNSIRHNLSLNKCFVKVARRKDEPGKGGFWKIDPAYADMFVDGVFKRRRSSTKSPRKGTTTSAKSRSKSTSSLPTNRSATWNDFSPDAKRIRSERPTWNYYRHNSDVFSRHNSDVIGRHSNDVIEYFEEEIPPYTGGLKQDLSWNSLLTDSDTEISFRDALDSQGIIIDHNFRVLNSPFTSFTPATPPRSDVFVPEDNLDLTIHGVGLLPRMPPSPPRLTSDHPWAEEPPNDVMASLDFLVSQDMGHTF